MSKFDYPRLSRDEIATILAEAQIASVTDNDIKNPNPDFVSDLYTRLLIHLDLLHEEDQGQVEFAALEQLENPDYHVDSVRTMNMHIRIKELVTLVDCALKFTLKDLLRPQGDRTELYLSAILKFCLHKDTKMNLLRPIGEELTLLDEQRKEWEDKISQLNEEIADYNVAREKELPLVQEVDTKVKELQQTVTSLNNHQMSLNASLRKLKEKSKEMDGKIAKAEFDLVQSVQENANLCSKVVQSPDKLQVNSAKSIEKDYKALKAKVSDDGVLDKSLDAKLVERQAKAQQLDELRKAFERERDSKCDEASKEFNNVKLEAESRKQDLETRQRKVDAVVSKIYSITLKTNLVKENGAAKVQQLVHKCEEILEQFHQYKNSMGLLLQNAGIPEVITSTAM